MLCLSFLLLMKWQVLQSNIKITTRRKVYVSSWVLFDGYKPLLVRLLSFTFGSTLISFSFSSYYCQLLFLSTIQQGRSMVLLMQLSQYPINSFSNPHSLPPLDLNIRQNMPTTTHYVNKCSYIIHDCWVPANKERDNLSFTYDICRLLDIP